ncbi:MAG: hypothetical protein IT303_01410 [Dehalococcoidia bacterium]|nr:hypothetical protein [Dehalococcoidia bacterium]
MTTRAEMLTTQFQMAKLVFDAATGDLTDDLATKRVPGATIGAILPIYAHILVGLDLLARQTAQGLEPLAADPGWQQRTGIPSPSLMQVPGWSDAPYQLVGLRDYATDVFQSLFDYLAAAPDTDLDRQVPGITGGTVSLAQSIGALGLVHLSAHTGEIAALKGVHGAKGLPF